MKIAPGLYQVTHKGLVYQIEDIHQASDGEIAPGWMLYEMVREQREFINDYATKRAALAALKTF